jgi:hypothetical protein
MAAIAACAVCDNSRRLIPVVSIAGHATRRTVNRRQARIAVKHCRIVVSPAYDGARLMRPLASW